MTEDIEPSILKKFEVHKLIGKGAYGIVWKSISRETKTPVALKKCYDAFRCDIDAQRTFREVSYLQFLSNHENIVKLFDVYTSDNGRDIYLVFEYFPTDLQNVLQSTMKLDDKHYQYITYQLMRGLNYIHDAELIHRDIKPSNILINASCQIKICDFGLCRSIVDCQGRHLTDYVATRWYRPPEVLLGATMYDQTIDIWAVGCIIAEMYRGRVLWQGHSAINQLEEIISFSDNDTVENALDDIICPFAMHILRNISIFRRNSLKEAISCAPSDALDLIENCLAFSPRNRFSADLALSHAFLSDFRDPKTEIGYTGRPIALTLDDRQRMSSEVYRDALERKVRK